MPDAEAQVFSDLAARTVVHPTIKDLEDLIDWIRDLFDGKLRTKRSIDIPDVYLASKFDHIKGIANGTVPLPYIPSVTKRDEADPLIFAEHFADLFGRLLLPQLKSDANTTVTTNRSVTAFPGPSKDKRSGAVVVFDLVNPFFAPIRSFIDGTLPFPVAFVGLTAEEGLEFIALFEEIVVNWRYLTEFRPDIIETDGKLEERIIITISLTLVEAGIMLLIAGIRELLE